MTTSGWFVTRTACYHRPSRREPQGGSKSSRYNVTVPSDSLALPRCNVFVGKLGSMLAKVHLLRLHRLPLAVLLYGSAENESLRSRPLECRDEARFLF